MFADCCQGDVVSLMRCVDTNWYEGKLGEQQGLFPVSYVEQLVDGDLSPPSTPPPLSTKIFLVSVELITVLLDS